MRNVYIYILIMTLVTYGLRTLPMLVIRKPITNTFINSFLYYVPYVTLALMTFPGMIHATDSLYSGIAALLVTMVLAYKGMDLTKLCVVCIGVVLVTETFL